ncbi:MAG: DivIVA domain-containing protein, partial [Propionicimonas sp.]
MTLTLEQVRQTRFHLARRNGYEPVDVDNFVDKVEATLSQLNEENSTLKQQVEALSSSEPSSIFVPGDSGDADQIRAELQGVQGELSGKAVELDQTRAELDSVRAELEALRRGDQAGRSDELDRTRGEL